MRPDPIGRAKALFLEQRERFFLFTPLPIMAGIALYFTAPEEPRATLGPSLLMTLASLCWLLRRKPWIRLLWPFALVALGFAVAQIRTHSLIAPQLTTELRYADITGTLDAIEPMDDKTRIILSAPVVEGLPPEQTPRRLRLSLRQSLEEKLLVGDRLRLKANLYPPPSPTMPGGYEFARYFYFNRIGGTGYSLSMPQRLSPARESSLAHTRQTIGDHMREHLPEPLGAIAAAMTIGEAGAIPEEVNNALRDTGLYHILSISGFHLAVVTGILFVSLRFLLALLPRLALRVPAKKIACLASLAGAFSYLALAGFPLPAQRSFIMVACVAIALLLDRKGLSQRSLCFAALFVLLAFPESLFSASFQMSFAATLAIITLAESSAMLPAFMRQRRWITYPLGIFASSLAASLATAPFVIYDFNRLSLLGMLANMLVLPLASLIIMPALVLAVLLMPLGMAAIAYAPLAWGLSAMIAIAAAAAAWPLAAIRLPSLSDTGLLLAALGLLWFCLWRGRLRLLGLPLLLASLLTIASHRPVDIFVSDEVQQILLRLSDGQYTAAKGTARAYAVKTWLQSEAQEGLVPLKESGLSCENDLCTYEKNDHRVLIVTSAKNDEALEKACAAAPDLLIAPRFLNSRRCPQPRRLLGKKETERLGAHALRLLPGILELRHARDQAHRRLWQPGIESQED